ncbi:MAG: hypothetical protein RLY21_2099 [Planctomycetota bacterium]|jgi:hypothetical protein
MSTSARRHLLHRTLSALTASLLTGAIMTPPANAQQTAAPPPAQPVVVRSDPKIREVRVEVGCYATKNANAANPLQDDSLPLGGAYRIPSLSVGLPVLSRTSWCDTDFTALDARAYFDGREFKLDPSRVYTKPASGVEAMLRFEGSPPAQSTSEMRFVATYLTQRWEVTVDERAAAKSTWPREWPAWTQRYLVAELGINPGDAALKSLAEQATAGGARSASPFVAAKNAVIAVLGRWKSLAGSSSELGPDKSLRGLQFSPNGAYGIGIGRGTPVELATTCVSAIRAIGIPSRVVYGLVVNETRGGKSNANFRMICEFYLPDIGWIPFDPVEMRSQGAATRGAAAAVKGFANVSDLEDVIPLAVKPVPDGFQRADRFAVWGWNLGAGSQIDSDYAISRLKLLDTSRGNGKVKSMPAPLSDEAP